MQTFQYSRSATVDQAVQAGAKSKTAQQYADVRFVAGGTTLVDLMKLDVERPNLLVDINGLQLDRIEPASNGGLVLGALARNSAVAHHAVVQRDYPGQSVATHPLRVLSRYGARLQQARAWHELFRNRWAQSHACDSRHEQGLHCFKPIRSERCIDGLGSNNSGAGTERQAHYSDSGVLPQAWFNAQP